MAKSNTVESILYKIVDALFKFVMKIRKYMLDRSGIRCGITVGRDGDDINDDQ